MLLPLPLSKVNVALLDIGLILMAVVKDCTGRRKGEHPQSC